MPTKFTAEELAMFDLWQGFTTEELEALLPMCEDAHFEAGQAVLHEGARQRALWLLVRGRATAVLSLPGGGEQTMAELGPGSVVGELSFLQPAPHTATVRCTEPSEFVRLDRSRFDELCANESRPAFHLLCRLAETVAARLQATDQLMHDVLATTADAHYRDRARQMREAFYHFSEGSLAFMRGPMV